MKKTDVFAEESGEGFAQPGLAAFIAEPDTSCDAQLGELRAMLQASGFELLHTITPDRAQPDSRDSSQATVLIAFDAFPLAVTDRECASHPRIDNARILDAARRCRQLVRKSLPRERAAQAFRSTASSSETWNLIHSVAPESVPAIRSLVESRRAEVASDHEVLRDLSRYGRRSKVELIRYRDGLAVKKTCRHQALRFLNREADFLEAMSPYRFEILPVIERGDNYFITPFIDNAPIRYMIMGRSAPKLLTLRQVRQVADLLHYLFERGYDPVDFTPHNLLIDQSGNVKAIDFEFVHHSAEPVDPEYSACLAGVREGFQGEWPQINMWSQQEPYLNYWYGSTGLGLRSFLYDPAWLQSIKRAVNYPTYLARKLAKRSRRVVGQRVTKTKAQSKPASSPQAVQSVAAKNHDPKVVASPRL